MATNPLNQGWKRPCVRCKVGRHDRCFGPMDCGCPDPSHQVVMTSEGPMTQEEYDQLVRRWEEESRNQPMPLPDDGAVIIPIDEIAARLTKEQWLQVGQMNGYLTTTIITTMKDGDAEGPPDPAAGSRGPTTPEQGI